MIFTGKHDSGPCLAVICITLLQVTICCGGVFFFLRVYGDF